MHPLLTGDEFEGLAYAFLTILVGLVLVWYGFHRHTQRRLIQDTATSEVESAAVGAVELTGTAEPAEATVTAPLSDEECVVVDYDVEEYKRHDDLAKEWVTVDSDVIAESFYLDDGTGEMLVDASDLSSDYDISDRNRTRETYESTHGLPDPLDSFLVERADVSPDGEHRRRYTQAVIPAGSDVYVFGDAEAVDAVESTDEPESALVVTKDDDTEMFLISDKAEEALVSGRRYSLLLWGLVGLVVFSIGLWWFLSVLGV